jgi:hypothetical protein
LFLVFAGSFPVQATGLLFEDTRVPANYPQVEGSPTWSLEAIVVRADDNQRHPLAAFIDGTPESNPRPSANSICVVIADALSVGCES